MQNETTKSTITQPQYYQLLGCLALAQHLVSQLYLVENAANAVLNLKKEDHVMDAVWSGEEPQQRTDELLAKLGITVLEENGEDVSP